MIFQNVARCCGFGDFHWRSSPRISFQPVRPSASRISLRRMLASLIG